MDLISKDVPSALITPQQLAELKAFGATIPGIFHWGMLETRLGQEGGPIDVLGALLQEPETRHRLRQELKGESSPRLAPAEDTLRSWISEKPKGFATTPNLWLEWDRDGRESPPLPWLCIAPDFFSRGAKRPDPEELEDLVRDFLSSDSRLFVVGAATKVKHLARAVPEGGQLMGFASLRPRGRDVCRVFARLPAGGTRAWLDAIDWPGDRRLLEATATMFHVQGESEWCQIEFDTHVGPHVALELGQTERGFPRREARANWLRRAVEQGWATDEKADALMNWHGQSPATLSSGLSANLMRSFHLKLSTGSSGQERIAKAYLGFYFRKPGR